MSTLGMIYRISIPNGILQRGENTVQIRLASGSRDNFIISMLVIHWKDSGFFYFDRLLPISLFRSL